jgi:hypothetical protein
LRYEAAKNSAGLTIGGFAEFGPAQNLSIFGEDLVRPDYLVVVFKGQEQCPFR